MRLVVPTRRVVGFDEVAGFQDIGGKTVKN